ncbi:hypothetical protein JB92DRAFT_3114762 [Gautieria morchelliformis]|nr:hypothetical protein JB92DRAFT_3114762 [Gautieria morchelliformis]
MALTLDGLPTDILIRVFEELDVYDIRRCSLTGRVFHETIPDNLILQYRLELAIAGLEDRSTDCGLSVAERLAQVKAMEEGWANLSFRQKFKVTFPGPGPTWNLYGGVLVRECASDMASGLSFIQLPYAVRGTPVHMWQIDIQVNILYYAINPAQDLAVLIGWPVTHDEQRHTVGIHLRTMSTGAHHPCASDPVLACVLDLDDPQDHFVIELMGDFLALLHYSPEDSLGDVLFIWDWKTGQLLIKLRLWPPA